MAAKKKTRKGAKDSVGTGSGFGVGNGSGGSGLGVGFGIAILLARWDISSRAAPLNQESGVRSQHHLCGVRSHHHSCDSCYLIPDS